MHPGKGAADARRLLNEARGDALVEGRWCTPGAAPAGDVKFDTVLCGRPRDESMAAEA